ncbi:MAG: hypothetical protein ABL880_04890 [Methylotenera sp.]
MYGNYFSFYTLASSKRALGIALCWLVIVSPPLATWLKHSMLSHMLIQLSLLVLIGVAIGQQLNKRYPHILYQTKMLCVALLLLSISTMMVWMIPRLLDLAVENVWVDAAKILSLPLLAGLPLYFAWQNFGQILRGILHLEALATLLRLAWLYIESPTRLCVQYGLDDQKRLGAMLIGISSIYTLYLLKKALVNPKVASITKTSDESFPITPI